jgi:aminoglycoside phosphotransferase (APT) family kinase protein
MTDDLRRLATLAARRRGAGEVRTAGRGTEFAFFVADNGEGYRVPRADLSDRVNDPDVSAYHLQRKEQVFTTWAAEHDLPAAEVRELLEIEGTPVLVVTVVEDDGSELAGRAFGRVLARMHQTPPPTRHAPPTGNVHHQRDLADTIAARLTHRHAALTKYGLKHLPAPHHLAEIIRAGTGPDVVNHLDLRRQNVRCQDGEVKALFDWSNALLAPVELELARLTEYAEIAENGLELRELIAGYREAGGIVADHTDAWRLLRLDAAVMLANLFDSVVPNPRMRDLFLKRSAALL